MKVAGGGERERLVITEEKIAFIETNTSALIYRRHVTERERERMMETKGGNYGLH